MTVKSDKSYKIQQAVCWFSVYIMVMIFFVALKRGREMDREDILFLVFSLIIISIAAIGHYILDCRTLVFTEQGICVKIAFYSKMYQWTDFKEKRIMEYDFFRRRGPVGYERGAVFSIHRIRRHLYNVPIEERFSIHLFSRIYVNFPWTNDPDERKKIPMSYPIDEKLFRDKMKEWGVQIDEKRRSINAYNYHR